MVAAKMVKTNKKKDNEKNTKLWNSIKRRVKASSKGGDKGQWSARKAQMAVKKYKARGGKYRGKKREKIDYP